MKHKRKKRKLSNEHKKKIGKAHIGMKHTEESKIKISNSKKGKKLSKEHKKNISKAKKGKKLSEEHKNNISKANVGKKHRKFSKETKKRMSKSAKSRKHSKETKIKIGKASIGRKHSIETRMKISIARSGEKSNFWKGGISFSPYCPKFNNRIKTEIRDKYMNMCLLCGKTTDENGMELDVHHVDYNKNQGCNDHSWELVPLCKSCHAKTTMNRKLYEHRIKKFLKIMEVY